MSSTVEYVNGGYVYMGRSDREYCYLTSTIPCDRVRCAVKVNRPGRAEQETVEMTTVHGPWLTKEKSSDPTWKDTNGNSWCWARLDGRLPSVFDIPKDTTEVRFVLSSNYEDGLSYKVERIKECHIYIEKSNGNLYDWGVLSTPTKFIESNSRNGKMIYLSLECR